MSIPAKMQKALQEAKLLNYAENLNLGKVLLLHEDTFDGSLGVVWGCDYPANLKDDSPRSLQKKISPVAKCHENEFKSELDRLMKLKVIKKLCTPDTRGNFVFPEFTVPKKNTEEESFVSYFRELNERVQRIPCLVSTIRDTFNKLEGFQCATTTDTSASYWHASLDIESQLKWIVTTPWGRHVCTRLLMGASSSLDMFQENNVLASSRTWEWFCLCRWLIN